MHDCPFCLQNEDSQEEADDAALQEMEIEAAMEAEAVAEGVKRKTREEAASPVRAGGGPAGKKLTTNASPPAGQRSPVPPTQRSPSPESPPFTQGGSEAARLSIPSFGIDIYGPESDQQGIYHGEGSYARRHVGVLGLQG